MHENTDEQINRREYLGAMSAFGFVPKLTMSNNNSKPSDKPKPLPEMELIEHKKTWVKSQLRDHYGDGWNNDIYYLRSDKTTRVPKHKTPVRMRADSIVDRVRPDYSTHEYDCEDFMIHLYSAMTRMYPLISVGLAWNLSGGHSYNIFLTENGIMEYDPQLKRDAVVTKSENDVYQFDRGVLFI